MKHIFVLYVLCGAVFALTQQEALDKLAEAIADSNGEACTAPKINGEVADCKETFTIVTSGNNVLELMVNGHNLRSIPTVLKDLTALTYLDLSQNSIATIPNDAIPNTVKTLVLSTNALKNFPATLASHQALTNIDISDNFLTSFDVDLSKSKTLRNLDVSDNYFDGAKYSYLYGIVNVIRTTRKKCDGRCQPNDPRDLICVKEFDECVIECGDGSCRVDSECLDPRTQAGSSVLKNCVECNTNERVCSVCKAGFSILDDECHIDLSSGTTAVAGFVVMVLALVAALAL